MKLLNKRIFVVHLLNNFSGSPKICARVAQAAACAGAEVQLVTSNPLKGGFLSGLPGVNYRRLFYRFHTNTLLAVLAFAFAQAQMFFTILFSARKGDCVYLSTILPAAAALAAKVCRCSIIYHVHESGSQQGFLHRAAYAVMKLVADEAWFVSEFTRSCYHLPHSIQTAVVTNSLDANFYNKALSMPYAKAGIGFSVAMICSNKLYKGTAVFCELAKQMPQLSFNLVLDASHEEVEQFKLAHSVSSNCNIFPRHPNVVQVIEAAHLIVNLSIPSLVIETFGLTLLEAMACGRPVIAPPVGGPCEFVRHGYNGFLVDSRNMAELISCIAALQRDEQAYLEFCRNARETAVTFKPEIFDAQVGQRLQAFISLKG